MVCVIGQAMDMFDMGFGCNSLIDGIARVKCPVLVLTSHLSYHVMEQY